MSGKRTTRDASRLRRATLLLIATLMSGAVIVGAPGSATAGESRSWPSARLELDCVDYGDYMHWGGSLDDTSPLPGGLALRGNHLYVAQGGITVVDISDPMQPVVVPSNGSRPAATTWLPFMAASEPSSTLRWHWMLTG